MERIVNLLFVDIKEVPMPILMASWSKVWICVRSFDGLWVGIPPDAWISVSCECCVLSV